jgi:hypothetical protein
MEADDLDIILERIDESGDLRSGLGAYFQERMHGMAADRFIGILEGSLLQSASEYRQNSMSALAEVSQGRGRLPTDIQVGILQQGKETFHRFQSRSSRMPDRSLLDAFEGTVMAEPFQPVSERRLLTKQCPTEFRRYRHT